MWLKENQIQNHNEKKQTHASIDFNLFERLRNYPFNLNNVKCDVHTIIKKITSVKIKRRKKNGNEYTY